MCSARALFAPPPPRALGRQHLRDRCACHLPAARLPYVSPSGPPARSLVCPPTHARASQARQTRLPPARSLLLERVGASRASLAHAAQAKHRRSAASCSRARPCVARCIRLGGHRAGEPASWLRRRRSRATSRVALSFLWRAGAWLYRVNGGVASHGLAVLVFGVGECTTKCAASLRAGTTTAGGSPTLWLRGRSGCGVCVRHDTAFTGAWFSRRAPLIPSVNAGGDVCDELSSDCSRPVRVLA